MVTSESIVQSGSNPVAVPAVLIAEQMAPHVVVKVYVFPVLDVSVSKVFSWDDVPATNFKVSDVGVVKAETEVYVTLMFNVE